MRTPFRLDQHPRRAQPLSGPPAGYFEQLPTRLMARVAAPARRALLPAWLLAAPTYLRTGLASTLLLSTFAASLWLSGGWLGPAAPAAASLDTVPREQLVDYLLSGEAHPELSELAEQPAAHLSIARQYLQPSARDLKEALDAQPAESAGLL